jgi:alkaline phosphatase D
MVAAAEQAIGLLVDDLDYLNINQRGYLVVTFEPEQARADWHFVDTVKSRDYSEDASRAVSRRVPVGGRQLETPA